MGRINYAFDFETLGEKNVFMAAIKNTKGEYMIRSSSDYPLHIKLTCSMNKMNEIINYVCRLAHDDWLIE
jgi:hypothetical protein